MADDRSDSSSSAGGRKAKPPVIELTATDKTPEERGSEDEASSQKAKPRETTPNGPRSSPLLPILSGVIGLLGGALVLSLIFLFIGEGAKRSAVSETAPRTAAIDAAARARVEQLAKTQGEMEKRLGGLEAQLKGLDLSPLQSRLDAVESGVKELHKSADEAQSKSVAANAALMERLNAIEAQVKQAASRPAVADAAEVVALGALQDAIRKGGPFKKELDVVRTML
ncbi:MAG TPA: hypothetical protein VHD34_09105, partial [Xanthobacteraceae bacterium]|nr:hypothetical protein [Xanthobacteraceae bacterium]